MYGFTLDSLNRKTGRIPVTTSPESTCPESCSLKKNGCYAESGPMLWRWQQNSLSFEEMISLIFCLPKGKLWRHNQAGDLPGLNEKIDCSQTKRLVEANEGKLGWTYTHKPVDPSQSGSSWLDHNLQIIQYMNDHGFTVNLSADGFSQLDQLMQYGLPCVTILPSWIQEEQIFSPGGHKICLCKACINPLFRCVECQWCQKRDRSFAIGFPAHGRGKRKVNDVFSKENTR